MFIVDCFFRDCAGRSVLRGGWEFAGQTCAQIYRADSAKLPGWEGRCPNRRLRSPDSAAKLAHAPGTVGAEKQFQAPPQFVRWGHFAYIYAEKKHLNYPLQFSIDVERAVALCSAAMRGRGARFMHWARAISELAGGSKAIVQPGAQPGFVRWP